MLKARADRNQKQILGFLQQIGASYQLLHTVGGGCPDLMVGIKGRNYLFEIKDGKNKLNARQRIWFAAWQGSAHVVYDVYDVMEILFKGERDGTNHKNAGIQKPSGNPI